MTSIIPSILHAPYMYFSLDATQSAIPFLQQNVLTNKSQVLDIQQQSH
jgi:hypothetical protein